jgi:hypothetical protein
MKQISILIFAFLLQMQFTYSQTINHWETAVFKNDTWRYFVGTSEPDANWRTLSFSDTNWLQGIGGFGFGDNDDNTIIPQTSSVYLRIKFTVADTSKIAVALLNMDYDDAFVAYLNDIEIARVGISGVHPAYNDLGNDHEATMYKGNAPESFLINKQKLGLCLRPGDNILAIQVHNSSATSSDLSSNAFLSFAITDNSTNYRAVPSWFKSPMIFTSSNLPIVVITTKPGEIIMDEPKITADMKVIYNGPSVVNYASGSGNEYTGKIGIEIRGSYSASLPQKPYGIETRDTLGENRNVKLLGMPSENDWVLLANYNDKSFLRNSLPFNIFQKMGHYAPRMRYCEVTVNDDYQGIYLLGEKIKQDKKRVAISSLDADDNAGDSITGGYIFKTDYYDASNSWLSNFSPINKPGASVYFVYHDPQPEDLTVAQKAYIKSYVNTVETVLYGTNFKDPVQGYRAYLDVNSFVDYFIIGEISRNVDAYKKSRYFYKNRDSKDRKIYSGPVWDYDWAWKNITGNNYFSATDGSGWAYKINDFNPWPVPPSWEVRMMQDTTFANAINSRYFNLRNTILSTTQINHFIDSIATYLNEAQVRHYTKWPTLGINVGTPEVDAQPTTFSGDIQKFKNWIAIRLNWLDANMVGRKSTPVPILNNPVICRIFPNPVSDMLYIQSDNNIKNIDIISTSGITVIKRNNCNENAVSTDVSQLTPGIYIIKTKLSTGKIIISKIMVK